MAHRLRTLVHRAVAAVASALLVVGCSGSEAGPVPSKPSLDKTSLDGPLVWRDEDPVISSGPTRRFIYAFGIPLRNKGDAAVTIDRVRLQPHPGVVNVTLLKAVIAGPNRKFYSAPPDMLDMPLKPAVGYEVPSQKLLRKGQYPPLLLLKVGPGNAPQSYNENVQVYYHDENGTPFVAIHPFRYVLCLVGETQPSCWKDPPQD